jgi:hypothetical protein
MDPIPSPRIRAARREVTVGKIKQAGASFAA